MDRKKIKIKAREMLKGNVWNVLLPFVVCGLISGIVSGSFLEIFENPAYRSTSSLIIGFLIYPLNFGCLVYVLKFVRKKPSDLKDVFSQYKKFFPIFALYFLVALFCSLWSILLIIPGIIAALSYTMAPYIMADGEDDAMECIRKSKTMMEGYKWDYFKFIFSFFPWFLLVPLTLGFILIYLGPYMSVAQTIYYEELRKIS